MCSLSLTLFLILKKNNPLLLPKNFSSKFEPKVDLMCICKTGLCAICMACDSSLSRSGMKVEKNLQPF